MTHSGVGDPRRKSTEKWLRQAFKDLGYSKDRIITLLLNTTPDDGITALAEMIWNDNDGILNERHPRRYPLQ